MMFTAATQELKIRLEHGSKTNKTKQSSKTTTRHWALGSVTQIRLTLTINAQIIECIYWGTERLNSEQRFVQDGKSRQNEATEVGNQEAQLPHQHLGLRSAQRWFVRRKTGTKETIQTLCTIEQIIEPS